jgi:hypothetical protein
VIINHLLNLPTVFELKLRGIIQWDKIGQNNKENNSANINDKSELHNKGEFAIYAKFYLEVLIINDGKAPRGPAWGWRRQKKMKSALKARGPMTHGSGMASAGRLNNGIVRGVDTLGRDSKTLNNVNSSSMLLNLNCTYNIGC